MAKPNEPSRGYSYAEAAKILRKSVRTIKRWVEFEILPVKRITQQSVILCREAVDRLADPPAKDWGEDDARYAMAHRRG